MVGLGGISKVRSLVLFIKGFLLGLWVSGIVYWGREGRVVRIFGFFDGIGGNLSFGDWFFLSFWSGFYIIG